MADSLAFPPRPLKEPAARSPQGPTRPGRRGLGRQLGRLPCPPRRQSEAGRAKPRPAAEASPRPACRTCDGARGSASSGERAR